HPAEVYVINTCTVTERADVDARRLIRQAIRQNPTAFVVATGCYAQAAPERIAAIDGVDLILGNVEKMDLMRHLRTAGWEVQDLEHDRRREQGIHIRVGNIAAARTFEAAPAPERPDRTRPFLKIQDGCNFACTFCIIPAVRGPNRSLLPDRVVEEGRRLAAGGHPEIVLTGINLGTYGWDLTPRTSLSALLHRLLDETPIPRIRVSSLHPHEIKPEMIRLFGASPRLCRHIHLALQSGDDEILRRMVRSYRSRHFRDVVERLHQEVPGIAIGVDVIVGFPGETEVAFESTRRLLEELPVSYFHVFTYSRRSGTKAAEMPDQVPAETKARRNRILRQLGEHKFLAFKQSFIGHTLPVVVLGERDCETGLLHGVSDNYLGILFGGPNDLRGRLVDVRVEGMGGRGMLSGRVLAGGSVPQPALQRPLPLVVGC
ncbi:MAG: tRNA (N(6)-L-threonylcarbamoyladenosine(37)-C(2))-methylthiotransferase MtaB, partial [candidate division NC10 bacterium]|nr:tRNA (N(6)-L-threonylcarbamoyladenosine(37)-C(2))-methylthiotransferase MtaB [candidate division NC10 bacterium]